VATVHPTLPAPKVATMHGTTTTTTTATKTATVPSFQDRMARTTVTPPVAATGAKATLVTPPHATALPTPAAVKPTATQLAATKATVAPVKTASTVPTPAKVAVAPHATTKTRPAELALFLHAKPDWTFRQVKSGASTTAGMHTPQLAARSTTGTMATKNGTRPGVTGTAITTAATVATTKLAATMPAKGTLATKPGMKPASPANTKPVPGALAAKTHPATVPGAKGESMSTSVQTLGARFMEQREQYVYDSLNRRDPFASLVSGSFETEVGTPLLDVSSMKLVGIVWGATDKFALVEDGHGHGFVLRVGDPVLNGYIAGLTKEELIVKQSSYGDTQTVTIQLQRKDGASNGN
jgi:hypothetical protein